METPEIAEYRDFGSRIVKAVTFDGSGSPEDIKYATKELDDNRVKVEFSDGATATFTGAWLRQVAESKGL